MTDLERVREALREVPGGNPTEQRLFTELLLIIDTHLKEDAERDRALEAYVAQGPTDQEARQLSIEEHNARVKAETELIRLREALRIITKNGSYSDALLAAEALKETT